MNKWECDHRDENNGRCTITAVGVGGSLGLRAIGWTFSADGGGLLLCPVHREDTAPCRPIYSAGEAHAGEPCHACAGENEAERWQLMIKALGTKDIYGLFRLSLGLKP